MLREVREIAGRLPLVAIGGIDLNSAASVLAAGADSIAVISGLLANGSTIAEQTRKFISLSVKTV